MKTTAGLLMILLLSALSLPAHAQRQAGHFPGWNISYRLPTGWTGYPYGDADILYRVQNGSIVWGQYIIVGPTLAGNIDQATFLYAEWFRLLGLSLTQQPTIGTLPAINGLQVSTAEAPAASWAGAGTARAVTMFSRHGHALCVLASGTTATAAQAIAGQNELISSVTAQAFQHTTPAQAGIVGTWQHYSGSGQRGTLTTGSSSSDVTTTYTIDAAGNVTWQRVSRVSATGSLFGSTGFEFGGGLYVEPSVQTGTGTVQVIGQTLVAQLNGRRVISPYYVGPNFLWIYWIGSMYRV